MTAIARNLLGGVRVAPSILSADFGRLREQVREVLDAGARVIHVDVMDGHFVPPITIGPLVVAALREQVAQAGGMLDVHLMIERPERHIGEFVRAGADSVTFHVEATPHAAYAVNLIREEGACVGVAINPGTPAQALAELAGAVDLALCMTVSPGWGGQPFIARSPGKIARLRALLDGGTVGAGGGQTAGEGGDEIAGGSGDVTVGGGGDGAAESPREESGAGGSRGPTALEIDGGIDATTAPRCREAGATLFVAGSAIFGAKDPGAAYRAIAGSIDAI